jgi:hypothetical protein
MASALAAPTEIALRPEFVPALSWPERAKSLKITDAQSMQLAADERAGAKDLIKKAKETFDPICAASHAAWQVALRQRSTVIDPLEQAVKIYDGGILTCQREQERIAREAQRQAELEAQRQAEAELEKEVEHAEAVGASVAEVEAIIERPLIVQPAVAPAPPKPIGATVREKWVGQITDKRVFVEFVVANKRWELLGLLDENPSAVNALARSVKSAGSIDGLKFWNEGAVASSPARRS